jgi:tRNA modification GTPase|uniref:Probable tRNA modification GTPase MnmE n=1 Tax=Cyanidiaceae sp. MX-AZ01 TaxID=1503164 RepID=A0A060ADQ5_9RHOD|nr:tRNA modification GTPase [Cyanidiaceae sp. MX-AZ01]
MTLANVFIQDTIVAIATYLAPSSVAIIRLSGTDAVPIAKSICIQQNQWRSHYVLHTYIHDEQQQLVDEVLIIPMLAPRSYTRQDIVEIHCHGGVIITQTILQLLLNKGARLAQPGEFTLRAFLNGRLSLTQAESVLDLIYAPSLSMAKKALANLNGTVSKQIHHLRGQLIQLLAQLEVQLDFEHDDAFPIQTPLTQLITFIDQLLQTPSQWYRYGIRVAILGDANVGKSTLFNALVEEERSIVTSIPGTTVDVIETSIQWKQTCFRFFDTAGFKTVCSEIESKALAKTQQIANNCDLILWVTDSEISIPNSLTKPIILVFNKIDRLNPTLPSLPIPMVSVSALYGWNLPQLKQMIYEHTIQRQPDGIYLNERQTQLLKQTKQHLLNLLEAMQKGYPLEILSWHLKNAIQTLDENDVNQSTLNAIFSQFCIGK